MSDTDKYFEDLGSTMEVLAREICRRKGQDPDNQVLSPGGLQMPCWMLHAEDAFAQAFNTDSVVFKH